MSVLVFQALTLSKLNTMFLLARHLQPGGGGTYYICPTGRVSFSPIFSGTGYQKRDNFLEQRKFCYNRLIFGQIFVFLSILFSDFFQNRVSFEGENSRAG